MNRVNENALDNLIQIHRTLLEEIELRIEEATKKEARMSGQMGETEDATLRKWREFETSLRDFLLICHLSIPAEIDRDEVRILRDEIQDFLTLGSDGVVMAKERVGRPGSRILRFRRTGKVARVDWKTVHWRVEHLGLFLAQMQELSSGNRQIGDSTDLIVTEIDPIHWSGSEADLVDLFTTLRDKHYFKAYTNHSIFKLLVRHFVGKEGKIFKMDNLKRSLSQKEGSKIRPFEKIVENPSPDSSIRKERG